MNKKSEQLIAALEQLPDSFQYKVVGESFSNEAFPNENRSKERFHDASVEITNHSGEWRFNVEVKHVHRKDTLSNLKQHTKPNTLLICNPLSKLLASYCEQHNINFIDAAGNARIQNQNLTVWITGCTLPQSTLNQNNPTSTLTPGTAKLIFALLADEALLNRPFRELSKLANISLGMVSKGMAYLSNHRHLYQSTQPGKPRKLTDKQALASLWIQQYPHVLRPKLGGIQLSLSQSWQSLPVEPHDYWGGEVAAAQLTEYLQPEKLQLFSFEPLQKMIGKLSAKPDAQGGLWLVSPFWGQSLSINRDTIALLSVAELLASGDSRNIETARMINEQYLHLTTFP